MPWEGDFLYLHFSQKLCWNELEILVFQLVKNKGKRVLKL